MNLHHADDRPDWHERRPEDRSSLQRLAAATNGIVTPANLLSFAGFAVACFGLAKIVQADLWRGTALLVAGRLADTLDGVVAEATGTKSPLGETVDAGLDKAIAFITLVVLAATRIVPWWLAASMVLLNAWNVLITWYGGGRAVHVRPSRNGKWATFGYWASLALFLAAQLHVIPMAWLLWPAYIIAIAALVLGVDAAYGYLQVARGKVPPVISTATACNRIVVIRNPVSSEAHRANERIRLLRQLRPDCELTVIDTSGEGKDANVQLLRNHSNLLGPQTLLCIAAGDGTVNLILSALIHDQQLPARARQTPILPLWCGNANDLAYMLNGRWSKRRLRNIVRYGEVVQIKALECTLRDLHNHEQRHIAASYASFGATAYVAQELERVIPRKSPTRRFRASRFGQEVFSVIRALAQAPTFTITEHGRTRIMYERTYLNGSRFAKIFGLPFKLTDEKFHRNTIERKHPVTLLFNIIGLMNSRDLSKRAITHDQFTLHDTVWAQFDGEPVRLMNGTEATITVSTQPFYALSLRLKS